jgi:ATP-binding cassette subfamily B protein
MSDAPRTQQDEADEVRPAGPATDMRAGRFHTVGVPMEKSRLLQSVRRLITRLGPERPLAIVVLCLAIVSVGLVVAGPRVLGNATNLIFDGLVHEGRIDFAALHRTLWIAVALYVAGGLLSYLQAYVLAGVVQRTMFRLGEVETKLHAITSTSIVRRVEIC